MNPLKERVSVTIDSDIYDSVLVLSKADKRKLSPYINLILRNHVSATEAEGKLRFDKNDAGYIVIPVERGRS